MELDNIIKKVAGAYLASAVIAVIVLILTLGQPFVVFMGIGAMGLVTVLGDAIAQYGIEAVLHVRQLVWNQAMCCVHSVDQMN